MEETKTVIHLCITVYAMYIYIYNFEQEWNAHESVVIPEDNSRQR